MQIKTSGLWRSGAMLLIAGSLVACTVDSQEAPPFAGPSGAAQSLTLSASPNMLAHNGSAQSVVTVTMRDDGGQPLSGHRVAVGTSAGALSQVDVVTGSDGRAVFVVTAPALSTPAAKITVFATPFGDNADNSVTRTLTIDFVGPQNTTAPSPTFVITPEALISGEGVGFNGSGTTDEGQTCGGFCSYSWSFGDGASANGITVTHTYAVPGSYAVALTVTDSTGTVATARSVITVEAPPPPPAPAGP